MSTEMLNLWGAELSDQLIDDLPPETISTIAGEAARIAAGVAAAGPGSAILTTSGPVPATAGTTAAGLSAAAKVGVATLAVTLGTGVAAVTGTLPDPIQSWVAAAVDRIGIELPRPPETSLPAPLGEIPIPHQPLDKVVPGPGLPLDEVPIPDLLPEEEVPVLHLPSDDEIAVPAAPVEQFPNGKIPDATVPTVTSPTDQLTIPDLP